MKKLKIFLLLSILLCLGLFLNNNVSASSGGEVKSYSTGPKKFEVGDVLPAGNIKISWDFSEKDIFGYTEFGIAGTPYFRIFFEGYDIEDLPNFRIYFPGMASSSTDLVGNVTITLENDVTITELEDDEELSYLEYVDGAIFWEYLAYKAFEVGDVLPAGNIKISWDLTGYDVGEIGDDWMILSDGIPLNLTIDISESTYITMDIIINGSYESFYLDTPGYTIITLTNPCTITSHDGTADYHENIGGFIFWEVVSPEYLGDYDDLYDGELLDIEENYILPQSKVGIKLLYNNTGGTKSGTITYTFGTYGQIILTAQEDNLSTQVTSAEITFNFTNPNWELYVIDDSLANQSFGSTRGILFAGVLLDFSWTTEEERTITDITIEGDLEIDVIFTRILTEEELAYQEGFSNGYTTAREIFGWKDGDDWYNGIDAWNLGEKYARELYGFYDSTTDEWLSVDEYVARYGPGNGGGNGNGSTGASDFYNNFDKYFIPAMIIVFGGAIVLTILKVFKGRE